MTKRTAIVAALATAGALTTTACGGGGGTPVAPAPAPATAAPVANQSLPGSSIAVTIDWPQGTPAATASGVRRAFVSPSTACVTISVDGAPATAVNNPNLAPGATTTTKSTTVPVTVKTTGAAGATESHAFQISSYAATTPATTSATSCGGALLAGATVSKPVVVGQANALSVTLNGNLATIAITPDANPATPYVVGTAAPVGTAGAYMEIGAAPHLFDVVGYDAGKNVIVAPGVVPAIAVAASTADVKLASTATAGVYSIQAVNTGKTVTITGTGANLAGTAVTGTATVTTVPALYVANHFKANQTNTNSASVGVFAASATLNAAGNVAPLASIAGPDTTLQQVQFGATDANGVVSVASQGTARTTATDGSVARFAANATGDAVPLSQITGLNRPSGIALDAQGDTYVATVDHLYEFAPGASGNAAPINSIGADPSASPNNTIIAGPYGLAVDPAGNMYLALSEGVSVFANGQSGNNPPTQFISGMAALFGSDLGIAVDTTGKIYVTNFNLNTVNVYAKGATGAMTAPSSTITSTSLDQPIGIALDASNNIYVANYGSNSIVEFAAGATGAATPGFTISGAATGLNQPYGLWIK